MTEKKESAHIIATSQAIVIPLNEEQQKQAAKCLEKSGKITFSIKELEISSLPSVIEPQGKPVTVD